MIKNEIQFILNDRLTKVNNFDTNTTVLNYLRESKKLVGNN